MVLLEQPSTLVGSRSAPTLSRSSLQDQLLVHLHRADRREQKEHRVLPRYVSTPALASATSNTQLPRIVGGLMRGARSQLLDKHVARDDSKERLLLRNFGGRSPERLTQHARSLASLREQDSPSQEGEATGREPQTSATAALAAAVLSVPPVTCYMVPPARQAHPPPA